MTPGTARTWAEAKAAAEALTFMGVNGHLVTITSAGEQTFIEGLYDSQKSWIGLTDDPAFGGTESAGQPNPRVDGWVWVTGEPVTYTNWWAAGEPNNQDGAENFVTIESGMLPGGWNDYSGQMGRYVVEFETGLEPVVVLTLTEWGIAALVLFLAGIACVRLKRTRATA